MRLLGGLAGHRSSSSTSTTNINDPAFAAALATSSTSYLGRRLDDRRRGRPSFAGQVDAGGPIIGGGAGTGLSAKCAEAGGIDLIIIYNSGRFRMAGRG